MCVGPSGDRPTSILFYSMSSFSLAWCTGFHGPHTNDRNGFNMLCSHRQSADTFAFTHTQPLLTKCPYNARICGLPGEIFLYLCWNHHCTLTTDSISWNADTQNAFSSLDAILSYWKMYLCLMSRMHSWLQSHAKLELFELKFHMLCISKQYLKRAPCNKMRESEKKHWQVPCIYGKHKGPTIQKFIKMCSVHLGDETHA
jgi:hypothetical protein